MVFVTNSTEETKEVGKKIAEMLEESGHRYIAMRGEMGVGKTAFTLGFASYFSIGTVKSPTYTVMNEYRGKSPKSGAPVTIYHFDMYRITSEDDLYSIGYDDYIDSGAYSIVEWSENIEDFIPEDAVFITVSRCGDSENKRKITVQNSGDF